ncbi:hypothetical protein [uncultured Serinicoccus sp.]|uniref:hypothetical protein n=1 Tax=uncultured Serinicoccus sp. TaxID=735514 RepID=UPI002614F452|nr:hypothetical protein [uncultured Serinicoccus sp.]
MTEPLTKVDQSPSWAEFVDATCRRYAEGYSHGFAQGYVAAQQDAQETARQAQAAGIAQDHLQVHQARERAAARWGA